MQIKLIFTRKVVYLASFWKWEFLELGSGLLANTSWSARDPRNNYRTHYGSSPILISGEMNEDDVSCANRRIAKSL